MNSLFDKRFVIVSGKGGTGKTTLAAALALAAARRGRRVLIAELNVRPRIPALFGLPPGGYAPLEVYDGIETANIIPDECMREYGVMKLKFERIYRFVFENETMRRITGMIPGLNELLILGKLEFMERETVRRGQRPRWDLIIVDGPATGHGISLFRLPAVILDAVPVGPLADDARRILELLNDETRTSFQIAAVPEEMAVQEAIELAATLKTVLHIPPGYGLLNMVWPATLSAEERVALAPVQETPGDPLVAGVLGAFAEAEARRAHQAPMVALARERIGLPLIELPFLFAPELGLAEVEHLSEYLDGAIGAREAVEE